MNPNLSLGLDLGRRSGGGAAGGVDLVPDWIFYEKVSGASGEINKRTYDAGSLGSEVVAFDEETNDDIFGCNGRDGHLYYSVENSGLCWKIKASDSTRTALGRTSIPAFNRLVDVFPSQDLLLFATQNAPDLWIGDISSNSNDSVMLDTSTSSNMCCFNEEGTLIYVMENDRTLSTYTMAGVFIEELWDLALTLPTMSAIRVDTAAGYLFVRSGGSMFRFELGDGTLLESTGWGIGHTTGLFDLDRPRSLLICPIGTSTREVAYVLPSVAPVPTLISPTQPAFCALITG